MGTEGDLLRQAMRTHRTKMLLVELLGNGNLSQKRPNEMCNVHESAVRWSVDKDLHVAILDPARSSSWEVRALDSLRNLLQHAHHDWCALGVSHPFSGIPVARRDIVLSSFPINSSECTCRSDEVHHRGAAEDATRVERAEKASGQIWQRFADALFRLLFHTLSLNRSTELNLTMLPETVAELKGTFLLENTTNEEAVPTEARE